MKAPHALVERMRAATGASGELDLALLHLWQPDHDALRQYDDRYKTDVRDGVFSVWKVDGGYSASVPFPRFTASVDAALALVERLFGVDSPSMLYSYDMNWHASAHAEMAYTTTLHLAAGDPPEMRTFHGQSYTQPLAILTALLAALTEGE